MRQAPPPQTLGLLTAATSVGGLIGTAFSGPVGRGSRQGRATIIACVTWSAAVAGFGLVTNLGLALALLVVTGAFDVISITFCQTFHQSEPLQRPQEAPQLTDTNTGEFGEPAVRCSTVAEVVRYPQAHRGGHHLGDDVAT
jgi:hypothetical protein